MSGEYIKFSKIKASASPLLPTPKADDFILGVNNLGVSVPVDYYITGHLINDIEVGKTITIKRDSRNGVSVMGIMTTSFVEKIEPKNNGLIIHTRNSVYDLEWKDEE